jgi:hypothetical protein
MAGDDPADRSRAPSDGAERRHTGAPRPIAIE